MVPKTGNYNFTTLSQISPNLWLAYGNNGGHTGKIQHTLLLNSFLQPLQQCCLGHCLGTWAIMVEVPHIFVQSLVYSVIVDAMMGFDRTASKFFRYLFCGYYTKPPHRCHCFNFILLNVEPNSWVYDPRTRKYYPAISI
ncbi:hypothetical protein WN943_015114 [Citrus x changshan-huyou]